MNKVDKYEGREHAQIKHEILEKYLETLFMIIGQRYDEIVYVDCFAGPWCVEGESLEGTSIELSLRTMNKCRDTLAANLKKYVNFRATYIEAEPERYKRLSTYLSKSTGGVKADCIEGDFVSSIPRLLSDISSEAFAFFFIDPMDWSPIAPSNLAKLLQRPKSEFLINFMYDFFNRAVDQEQFEEHMIDFLGFQPILDGMEPKQREALFTDLYRNRLKEVSRENYRAPRMMSGYFSVLDRLKKRTKYELVYLSRNPLGIVKFCGVSDDIDAIQSSIHAQTRKKNQVPETQGSLDLDGEGVERPDLQLIELAKRYWREKLTGQFVAYGIREFAMVLEETSILPKYHQHALREMIETKEVECPQYTKNRTRNFVNFKNRDQLRRTVDDN